MNIPFDDPETLAALLPFFAKEDQAVLALLEKKEADRGTYRLTDLWIQTKDQRVVPFVPNDTQIRFLAENNIPHDTDAKELPSLRPLILKARQQGFSTLIIGLIFLNTINNRNTNSVVIAHDLESTIKLFRMVLRFYEKLPAGKPVTQYASKREIYWPSINSRISVETAGKGTAGRGDTIHNLAISEYAFWDDMTVLTGLLQAVPYGRQISIESTANGRGGKGEPFYTEYRLATGQIEETRDGRTASIFTPHFYPWHEHADYQAEPPPDFVRTEEEEELVKQYGVNDRQLYWRRLKMMEPGMGAASFAQEYPMNPEEAFMASGMTFFDRFTESEPHVRTPIFTPDDPPPSWYVFRGGMDWGTADPFAYVISGIDERGRKHILESYEETRLQNAEMAELVCKALKRWGIPKSKFIMIADGSMWNKKTIDGVQFPPDIEAFQKAGLNCVPAAMGEEANKFRWNQIRDEIADDDNGMVIYRGWNNRLIECLLGATHDPNKREKMKHDQFSHLCFIAGTLIKTIDGLKPIETITTADMILTRQGYRRVVVSKLTQTDARVFSVKFSNDVSITGTQEHPIFVHGKGFTPISEICYNDVAYALVEPVSWSNVSFSYLMESFTSAIQKVAAKATGPTLRGVNNLGKLGLICTGMCGNILMAPSRKSMIFITSMATRPIMTSAILNVSLKRNTKPGIRFQMKGDLPARQECDRCVKTGYSLIGSLLKSSVKWFPRTAKKTGKPESRLIKNALTVAKLINRSPFVKLTSSVLGDAKQRMQGNVNFITKIGLVTTAAKLSRLTSHAKSRTVPVRVLSVIEHEDSQDVYNLEVDEVHEYFANGILVSNCVALGNAVSSYNTPAGKAPPPKLSPSEQAAADAESWRKKQAEFEKARQIAANKTAGLSPIYDDNGEITGWQPAKKR